MFEQAVLANGPRAKRVWTTCAGFTGQIVLIGCAVLAPVIWPQALPKAMLVIGLTAPGPPLAPPHRAPDVKPAMHRTATAAPYRPGPVTLPRAIPDHVVAIIDPPIDYPGVPGGIETGAGLGGPGRIPGGIPDFVVKPPEPRPPEPPRAPSAAKPPEPPRIIRVSDLKLAHLLRRVDPQYPPLARQARISGVVKLEGIIAVDGHLRQLTVLSGHPLLAPAALDAVRQWIYEPTILNGAPVEVIAPIIVTFTLN